MSERRTQVGLRAGLVALTLAFSLAVIGPAAAQGGGAKVRVDAVANGAAGQTVPVIGRLVARQAGDVAARINGAVQTFTVEVGDRVDEGQVIATLQVETLSARRDLTQGELSEAQALLTTYQARLGLAEQTLRRLEGLKNSAAFSQARYDDARQEVAIAEAELRESQSAIATAKAEHRMAEINLYNAEVRAPYAGVITQRLVEAGAYVAVGGVVVRMIADQNLEVEADVPFQHLAGLTAGTEVSFSLDDGTQHAAVVRAIIPQENPLTRTRAVRFVPTFGDTKNPVAVDQSATVLLPLSASSDILTVHKDAILRRQGNTLVFVVNEGVAEIRPVTLGTAVGSRFEVLQGLALGDLVVVRGNERLSPNSKVNVDGAT